LGFLQEKYNSNNKQIKRKVKDREKRREKSEITGGILKPFNTRGGHYDQGKKEGSGFSR